MSKMRVWIAPVGSEWLDIEGDTAWHSDGEGVTAAKSIGQMIEPWTIVPRIDLPTLDWLTLDDNEDDTP